MKYFFLSLTLGAAASLLPEARAQVMVDLGNAAPFAVLAGSGITIAGGPTMITGNIGSDPTPTITGLPNLTLNGTIHQADAVSLEAKVDLVNAYNMAAAQGPTLTYAPASQLGGLTLTPGVYENPSSFGLSGTLSLNGQGNPNSIWIFQMGSTLTTAADSEILLTNGAQASNIFWQVGSSATLGADTDFAGTILASESISLVTGATVAGRLLAMNGAVTLQSNAIIVPEPGVSLLVMLGVGLFVLRRARSGSESAGRGGMALREGGSAMKRRGSEASGVGEQWRSLKQDQTATALR